jgi:hypothetical protein
MKRLLFGHAGNHNPSLCRILHSSRRSGGCYSNLKGSHGLGEEQVNHQYTLNSLSFEGQKKQKPFFPLRQPAQTNRTQKPKAHGLRFTET